MKLNDLIRLAAIKYGYSFAQGPDGIWHLRPGNTSCSLSDRRHLWRIIRVAQRLSAMQE